MKKNKKRSGSLYSKCRLFQDIKLPTYENASKKHKELIDRILFVKDFCLAMPDSKDRELLILELIRKEAKDVTDKNNYLRNVMIAQKGTTIFGAKYARCPGVLETSFESHNNTYNFWGWDTEELKILIVDNINLNNMNEHTITEINNLVSKLRQKNKELKVLYIVDDLFTNNHYNFYRMLCLLNLNITKLNHILDIDNFISMFLEGNNDRNGIVFKNMKLLEVMLKKHLYIDPLEQIEKMKFNFVKVCEIDREKDLINTILQNMMNYYDASKTHKHNKGKTYISNYNKSLNIILCQDNLFEMQNIEKKHFYYKKKDFRIYNESVSTGRFSKSKYEFHLVNDISYNFILNNATNIKTIHIVIDVADEFLDNFLQSINLLYNGDFDNEIRLFIYFMAKKNYKSRDEEQIISNFNFENIGCYQKLLSTYHDIRSNIKLKYDEYKTFDEIIKEILGEE